MLVLDSLRLTIVLMVLAVLLPFVCAMIAKAVGGFRLADNADPRAFLAKTEGLAARIHAAQLNSFEGLPIFLAAVLMALYAFVPVHIINQIAGVYVASRLLFIISYAMNLSMVRSVSWIIGMVACLLLFGLAFMLAY